MLKCLFIVFLLSTSLNIRSQFFKFSVYSQLNLSQVDGDNLKGYHKIGANYGFQTEFDISKQSSIVIRESISTFGSKYNSDVLLGLNTWILGIDLTTANICAAYKFRTKINRKKGSRNNNTSNKGQQHYMIGFKTHFIVNNEFSIINRGSEQIKLIDSELKKLFHAVIFGFEYQFSNKMLLMTNYEIGISNLLKPRVTSPKRLVPFMFSSGLRYQF